MRKKLALLSFPVLALFLAGADIQQHLDVPFVPTPMEVVDDMLELAQPRPGDVLYDLGCGDGRIVIRAAEKYGIRAVGFDLNPQRILESRENAVKAGLADKVEFFEKNLFEVDLSPASIVTLYLLSSVNLKLRPKLFQELRPGSRVVSHDFDMDEWQADNSDSVYTDYSSHRAYFWIIPANVSGIWEWTEKNPGDEAGYRLEIEQKFQEFYGTVKTLKDEVVLERPEISGDLVKFSIRVRDEDGSEKIHSFEGRVSGDMIKGTRTIEGSRTGRVAWQAVRRVGTAKIIYE